MTVQQVYNGTKIFEIPGIKQKYDEENERRKREDQNSRNESDYLSFHDDLFFTKLANIPYIVPVCSFLKKILYLPNVLLIV